MYNPYSLVNVIRRKEIAIGVAFKRHKKIMPNNNGNHLPWIVFDLWRPIPVLVIKYLNTTTYMRMYGK